MAQDNLLRAHRREEVPDRHGQALLDQRVVDAVGLATLLHQPGGLEDAQVPRDGRSADREPGSDLPGGEVTCPQILEDLATGGIGEGPKDARLVVCHIRYLAT